MPSLEYNKLTASKEMVESATTPEQTTEKKQLRSSHDRDLLEDVEANDSYRSLPYTSTRPSLPTKPTASTEPAISKSDLGPSPSCKTLFDCAGSFGSQSRSPSSGGVHVLVKKVSSCED